MAASGRILRFWPWIAMAALMLAEFLLFDRMTSQHHTGIYPRWNDQIQYLTEAYTAYEKAQAGGLLAGFKHTLTKTALQGTLHDTAALCVFTLVGSPSRSAALSLNMLVFLAWQAALVFTVLRLTGSRALAWISFGLALCVAFPWSNQPGSAVDFRLDHAAMCLMGVTACAALLTDGFRRTGWSLAFGAAVGITLLTRFLTGAYFAAIFLALAGWLLGGEERWRRLARLVAAGAVAAALAGPAFWHNREAIYTYYWVGHMSGAESNARAPGLDAWHSLKFVFGQFASLHLGVVFGGVVAVVLGSLASLALFARSSRPGTTPRRRDWLVIAVIFAVLPGLILSLHRQKSEFVLGVLAPGTVLLVLGLAAVLADRVDWTARRGRAALLAVLSATVVAASGAFFVCCQFAPATDNRSLADARRVNQVADLIFATAHARHFTDPYIAVDQIVDYLDAPILSVTCYERKRVWMNFVIQLPNSILEEPEDSVFYKLKLCHFVVLTDQMPGVGHWPYDRQMHRLYPRLKAWCEANLDRLESFEIYGRQHTLYARRAGS